MSETRPNILFILTDQQRFDCLRAYGNELVHTPNIDRLTREGVTFDRAYTTCPLCTPARGSIHTGYYPHQHGLTSNVGTYNCAKHAIDDHPTLLSRQLIDAGYQCGFTGKWHLCPSPKGSFFFELPIQSAFTEATDLGFQGHGLKGHGGQGYNYPLYHEYLERNGLKFEKKEWTGPYNNTHSAGEITSGTESTTSHWITSDSIDLMNRFADDEPFFMFLNFWGPHSPYLAPTEHLDRYRDMEIPPWPNFHWPSRQIPGFHQRNIHQNLETTPWAHWEEQLRYYYAGVSLIDEQVGRLLDHLEQSGQLDNTIIVFSSDHGESCGSHGGIVNKGFTHWEETQRVPLIIRFPDGRQAGERCDAPVSLIDFYPTFLDWAGVENPPARTDGQSLERCLTGEAEWRPYACAQFHGMGFEGATQRTFVQGDFKYGWNCGVDDELYDLKNDPYETNNVIHHPDYQSVRLELAEALSEWGERTRDISIHAFREQYPNRLSTIRPYQC